MQDRMETGLAGAEAPAEAAAPEAAAAAMPERLELRRGLEALAAGQGDLEGERVRREVIALLRSHRQRGLDAAWRRLRRNPGRGRACAVALGVLHDGLLAELYRFVAGHVYRRANPSEAERLCLVAVGGCGRGTLAPGSDLDLLFLHPYKPTPWEEGLVEYMLRILWDVGLTVGHATRSVEGCLRAARNNVAVRTSLLDARRIAGDGGLFGALRQAFRQQVAAGGCADFIGAKLAERDERHRRFGASRYLVEPNIKESKGGLRDLDVLLWLAKYAHGLKRPSEMARFGLFTAAEYARWRSCFNFLWAVRCELHFWSGRAEDRLSFEAQLHVAQAWGYRDKGGLSAVECFMKRYYNVARWSGRLTRILCARLEQQGKKRLPAPRRAVADAAALHADFVVESGRLNAADDGIFVRDGCNFLRLFWLRAAHRAALHPHLVTLLAGALHRIDAALRRDATANRLFLDCLLCADAGAVLREMNEMGVLGRFVPEFGRVVGQMQFGMYHHYTVDEHTLRALGELRALEDDAGDGDLPLARSLAKRPSNRAALSLAVFLHDIAKGGRVDHSVAGERIAQRVGRRLCLPRAETELAAWLVRNHLLMNDFAQKRDIQDDKTIEDFAARVGAPERLRLLLLLTVADIRAVGPGVWNGWKGTLLRRLYHATEARLTGHSSALGLAASARRAQQALARQLAHWPEARMRQYLARFPADYWSAFETPELQRHAMLIAEADAAPPDERMRACLRIVPDRFRSATEMVCYQKDRPGLFATITGACARANVSIVDARIFTARDGMALELLRLREVDGGAVLGPHRIDSLRRGIEAALAAGADGAAAGTARPRRGRRRSFALQGEVWIDNAASKARSVIEITGLDRPGLLHELARVLFALGLNVISAHIATFGERAVDVFYVREADGGKVAGEERQREVREGLLRVLNQ